MASYRIFLFAFVAAFLSITGCNPPSKDNFIEIPISWKYKVFTETGNENREYLQIPENSYNSLANLHPDNKGFLLILGEFDIPENYNFKEDGLYSFSFGYLTWGEEIYLNGVLVGSAIDKKNQWNYWNIERVYPVHPRDIKQKNNKVLIKIYVEAEGSIEKSISLGERKTINQLAFKNMFFKSYLNGIVSLLFLVVGLYHFLMFVKRKKDKDNYYYGLFCILYSIYSLNFISNIIHAIFPNISYLYFQKIIFLCSTTFAYIIYRFVLVFLGYNFNKNIIIFLKYLLIIPFAILFFTFSYIDFFKYRGIINLFQLPYLLLFLGIPIYGVFKKNKAARIILGSIGIVFIAGILDTLNATLIISLPFYLTGIALPTFMISIMFILGNKFVNLHNETDDLKANLEVKVEERTKEVREKMEKITELKIQQDGDYFLTALIEKPLATNFNKSKVITTRIFTEQKKKFSFKNRYSELGGDICITGNLRFNNIADKYVFFFNGDAMGKSMQGAGGAIVAGSVLNNIIGRSARNDKVLTTTPDNWLKETYLEMDNVFRTFDGSMLISAVSGLIREETGEMWYFCAEHPFISLLRDGKASFLEPNTDLRKIGTPMDGQGFEYSKFKLMPGDILYCGSDGRDDIELEKDDHADHRIINEDETLFLKNLEKSHGDIDSLVKLLHNSGKITDDLSLIRIGYKEE